MAKPYFIFHAPQVRFIEKKQPGGCFFHGTPWGNRTLNCPLGGGCYIHLTKEAYMLFDAQYFIR